MKTFLTISVLLFAGVAGTLSGRLAPKRIVPNTIATTSPRAALHVTHIPHRPQVQSNNSVGWYAQLVHMSEVRLPSTYDNQGKLVKVGARVPGTGVYLIYWCQPAIFDWYPDGSTTINFTCTMSNGATDATWLGGPFPNYQTAWQALSVAMQAKSPKDWLYPDDMPPP